MKKVLKTTVAASLVFGSIAGLPLSSKGLQELLGTTVASASVDNATPLPSAANEWLQRAVSIYGKLTDGEQLAVSNFRKEVEALSPYDTNNNDLVDPLVTFINGKQTFYPVEHEELLQVSFLFSHLLYSNETQLSKGMSLFLTSPEIREVATKVLYGTGVSLDGDHGLQVADLVAFLNATHTAVTNQFKSVDKVLFYYNAFRNNTLLTTDKGTLKADLKNAFEEVLGNESLKLSEALAFYTPDAAAKSALADAIAETYLNFVEGTANGKAATLAVLKGALRNEAVLTSTTGGTELTPQLKLFGYDLTSFVTWGVETDNSPISVSGSKFVLSSTYPANQSVSADVYAKASNEIVFKGKVSLIRSENNPSNPGVTPGGTTNPGAAVKEALADAKAKLTDASPQEKSKIMKEAIASVKDALKEVAKISLSNAVTVSNGKATVNLNAAQIQQRITAIKAEVEALKASLKELDENATVEFVLTFDLGDVSADEVEFSLGGTIYNAVEDAGVSTVNVSANGNGIDFPVSEVDGDTKLSLTKGADEEGAASDVLTFEFTVPGGVKDVFNKPVKLGFTVIGDDFDENKLTGAKILEDGSLEIVGGKYNGGLFTVNRSSLSTYVVIENDVQFTDTASVDAWAGEEIETVAAKGIVEGRGAGDFDPNANVTRAEFAKMIARALGIYGGEATENFSDVSEDDWFQPYVAAVAEWGITNGRTPSTFDPNAPITRAEMATMIARALQQVEGAQSFIANEDALAQFADADQILASLEDGVAFAADLGIVQGLPSGDFAPNAHTTRAQAAVMISRLLQQ